MPADLTAKTPSRSSPGLGDTEHHLYLHHSIKRRRTMGLRRLRRQFVIAHTPSRAKRGISFTDALDTLCIEPERARMDKGERKMHSPPLTPRRPKTAKKAQSQRGACTPSRAFIGLFRAPMTGRQAVRQDPVSPSRLSSLMRKDPTKSSELYTSPVTSVHLNAEQAAHLDACEEEEGEEEEPAFAFSHRGSGPALLSVLSSVGSKPSAISFSLCDSVSQNNEDHRHATVARHILGSTASDSSDSDADSLFSFDANRPDYLHLHPSLRIPCMRELDDVLSAISSGSFVSCEDLGEPRSLPSPVMLETPNLTACMTLLPDSPSKMRELFRDNDVELSRPSGVLPFSITQDSFQSDFDGIADLLDAVLNVGEDTRSQSHLQMLPSMPPAIFVTQSNEKADSVIGVDTSRISSKSLQGSNPDFIDLATESDGSSNVESSDENDAYSEKSHLSGQFLQVPVRFKPYAHRSMTFRSDLEEEERRQERLRHELESVLAAM
ncbi:hypothetical protein BC830DRAFT_1165953 [Chytriomyces sp. MP71]|nr:hypothetical protein BC830DRAFT_1165953 [Chytriomyces sp. MP71]